MKKWGFLIFATALILGVVVSSLFSFGRISGKFTNFSLKVGSVKGSGQMGTEVRELSGFRKIDASGVFQVEIVAQKDFSVEVEADDNLLQYITTEVRRGVLKLETERKLNTSNPIRVRISAPDIEGIETAGAANVILTELKNGSLEIDSSGASKIKVSGETAKLVVDVSGATQVDAVGLAAENANVEASGASTVELLVNGNLKTNASGASTIRYAGSPRDVVKKSSGASTVSPK